MKWPTSLVQVPVPLSQCSTHLRDVTQYQHLLEEGKTAWETWKAFPEVTEAFNVLMQMQGDVSELSMSLMERFVVLVYDRTSNTIGVNEARKQLFTQKSRAPIKSNFIHIAHLQPKVGQSAEHGKNKAIQSINKETSTNNMH